MFVDNQVRADIRASAQGIFMMMTNGFGAWLGSRISGLVIAKYFTAEDGAKDWHNIWLSFAGYALVVAILFVVLFREDKSKASLKAV
jgi:NHS family xanthosine MFS transporter